MVELWLLLTDKQRNLDPVHESPISYLQEIPLEAAHFVTQHQRRTKLLAPTYDLQQWNSDIKNIKAKNSTI